MHYHKELLGQMPESSEEVYLHTLKNNNGFEVQILDLGATLVSVKTADRYGHKHNVCLGYDRFEDYLNDDFYLGATVGRTTNRIKYGAFHLNGKSYQLSLNSDKHHLHGGHVGLHKKQWSCHYDKANQLTLNCTSVDGDEGYPGNIVIQARFQINDMNELTIEYFAETDTATPFAMTNHSYWNLAGKGSIKDHQIQLNADFYLSTNNEQLVDGKIIPVANSRFDFTEAKALASKIQNKIETYDQYFIKRPNSTTLAFITEPNSGRNLSITTTEVGAQFYTGNFLMPMPGRDGQVIDQHTGLCIEPHSYPDAINNSHFPSTVISPERSYHQKTVYQFGIDK